VQRRSDRLPGEPARLVLSAGVNGFEAGFRFGRSGALGYYGVGVGLAEAEAEADADADADAEAEGEGVAVGLGVGVGLALGIGFWGGVGQLPKTNGVSVAVAPATGVSQGV
jgi:hypothetical protein